MNIGNLLCTDNLDRWHLALDPIGVDQIYEKNVTFWKQRAEGLGIRELHDLVSGQVERETPYNRAEKQKLKSLYREIEDFSMLEIGAATGTVFERLGVDNPQFRYVGFECAPVLAGLCRMKYPNAEVHTGDIEDFIAWETEEKFKLFYAHVSLIMIHPEIVQRALNKAAELCEQFLIYDFVETFDTPKGKTRVLYRMGRPDFWFVHDWDKMLANAGFKISEKVVGEASDDPAYDNQIRGCGYIHGFAERQ